jgi:hypothetical protein
MDPQHWFKRLCADLLKTDVDKVPHLVAEDPGGEARRRLVHNVLQQLEYGHRLVHTAYNKKGSQMRRKFVAGPGAH